MKILALNLHHETVFSKVLALWPHQETAFSMKVWALSPHQQTTFSHLGVSLVPLVFLFESVGYRPLMDDKGVVKDY